MSDSSDSAKTVGSRHDAKVTIRRTHPVRVSTEHENKYVPKLKIKVPPFSPEDPELWFALIEELKKMVQQLTLKLEEHTRAACCSTSRCRSRAHDRHRSSSRQRSRSNSSYRKYPMCWYHAKYGAQAHRCLKPCDFGKSGNSEGSR
ncbi:unnamed protein product [Parnassius mnemosyne]|uniref:Uncharacterized protein n=1 Tax=Parnassius mnemosyne TaxID=213953 RepID=A0AAV1KJU8_9NEOP